MANSNAREFSQEGEIVNQLYPDLQEYDDGNPTEDESMNLYNDYVNAQEDNDDMVEGTPSQQIPSTWDKSSTSTDMAAIHNKDCIFMIQRFKYELSEPNHEPMPIHGYQHYDDVWDRDHVRMPCSPHNVTKNGSRRWPTIQKALKQLENWCKAQTATIKNVQVTIKECTGYHCDIKCLAHLINNVYSDTERTHFISVVLPCICLLAYSVDINCSRPPPLLSTGSLRSVTMSQMQAASLLACAFFCLFPNRHHCKPGAEYEKYQNPNFDRLYHGGSLAKLAKLKCILHYFGRVADTMPNGVITIRRHVLQRKNIPNWSDSKKSLCPIQLRTDKRIEDVEGALQVDFANKYIGGGVLTEGAVQEEIRFAICPEMIISLLVCEMMAENECITLIGCERFSSYQGYAKSFKFKANYVDTTPKDSWGRKLCHVVAMDAVHFRNPAIQYSYEYIQRELVKAYTSFTATRVPAIATGNWGCGVFNGNSQLKAIIQLIAASEAERFLVYTAYRDRKLTKSFWEVYNYLQSQQTTVRDLYTYFKKYAKRQEQMTLFDFILNQRT